MTKYDMIMGSIQALESAESRQLLQDLASNGEFHKARALAYGGYLYCPETNQDKSKLLNIAAMFK